MRAIATSRATMTSSASAGWPRSPSEYEWKPSCIWPFSASDASSQWSAITTSSNAFA